MRILVTGATGFIGHRLVEHLCANGHDVIALYRSGPARFPPAATVRTGDMLDGDSVSELLTDVDIAYYLVHSMNDCASFVHCDRMAARNFVAAARDHDLDRVVYLSGLGGGPTSTSTHLRSRREVELILADGPFDLTVLRAAIVIGAGSAGFEIVRQLTARMPVIPVPPSITTRCQPIAIADTIEYLSGVIETDETRNETYEIGGPAVVSYGELLERVSEQTRGPAVRLITVPTYSPPIAGWAIGLCTDVDRAMATSLVDGIGDPVIVTDDRLRERLAIEPTPLATAIETACEATQ